MSDERRLESVREALAPRYDVERELGRGGMATVYLARDTTLARRVAVKLFRPDLTGTDTADRFLREIRVTAALEHPNILPLLDSGEAARSPYYVMPFVEGGTLRSYLRHKKQLGIDEAIRLIREVAEGLGTAHSHGWVHRDIKPENILLSGGHAIVADFGIAHAIEEVGGERLTVTGVAVGTPGYMSPEQAAGERDLDGRSDIYSLTCVLYEMLVGEMPFTGPSAQAILAKQLNLEPPFARTVRDRVPEALDEVIQRGLAKVPADRFETVHQFIQALSEAATEPRASGLRRGAGRRVPWVALGGTAAVVVVLGVAIGRFAGDRVGNRLPLDTTRYAIMPFAGDRDLDNVFDPVDLLRDAIARWDGPTVVPWFADDESPTGEIGTAEAAETARRLRAGRFIQGRTSRVGDSLRVYAALYDTEGDPELVAEHSLRLSANLTGADSLFARLADYLLFHGEPPESRSGGSRTRSLPAQQAFERGQRLLLDWDLALADSAFGAATRYDATFAAAQLWLALVRAWSGADPATWGVATEQALLGRAAFGEVERGMVDALAAQAEGDFGRACTLWDRLTEQHDQEFAAWYGLARCLRDDDAVVRDRASPSGFSFRASYREALEAYRRAFRLRPATLAAFGSDGFRRMSELLWTRPSQLRPGHALGTDSRTFLAYPAWEGDTLAFVPWPLADFASARAPRSGALSARRQAEMFRDIALAWATDAPTDPLAMEALALSLEMLSSPAALDTLRRARRMATSPRTAVRLAVGELWLLLKVSAPHNPAGVTAVKALADSLLDTADPETVPDLLAGVAALTGRAHDAAMLLTEAARRGLVDLPQALATVAPRYLVYASLGGPRDSLTRLEQAVSARVAQLRPSERHEARGMWLARPASLVIPDWIPEQLATLTDQGDALLDIQAALVMGDTATVRRAIHRLEALRAGWQPQDQSVDALLPESRLRLYMGDSAGARKWLAPYLAALPSTAPLALARIPRAGALARSFVLMADLDADAHVDAARDEWPRVVLILWRDADEFLQPVVQRMRAYLGE